MESIKDDDIDKIFLQLKAELRRNGVENDRERELAENRKSYHGPGFTMEIPSGFQEMDGAQASTVFFSKFRPEIILTHSGSQAGLTFQTLQMESGWEMERLEGAREEICGILKKKDGKNVFYEEGGVSGQTRALWFEYKSFASDERVYNLVFLFMADKTPVMGTFYCIFKDYGYWKPEILDMLGTIKTEEQGDERI